jgi:hypothetical protein
MSTTARTPTATPDPFLKQRQRDRARIFLALSTLSGTTTATARDFIEALADVASLNARHAVRRGDTEEERAEWRRLAEVLQNALDCM